MHKLKGAPNWTGFSFRGNWYPAKDGVIEIPLDAVETAKLHGWKLQEVAIEATPEPVEPEKVETTEVVNPEPVTPVELDPKMEVGPAPEAPEKPKDTKKK